MEEEEWRDGGKMETKLSEVNTWTASRHYFDLIGVFKEVAGDVTGIWVGGL